jgi:hypothetical protein
LQDLVQEANNITGSAWGLIQAAWIVGLDESIYTDFSANYGHGRHLGRDRFQWGTAAYIISRKGMEKIISSFISEPEGLIHLYEGRNEAEIYVGAASDTYVAFPSFFTVEGSETLVFGGKYTADRLELHQKSNVIHTKMTSDLYHKMQTDVFGQEKENYGGG